MGAEEKLVVGRSRFGKILEAVYVNGKNCWRYLGQWDNAGNKCLVDKSTQNFHRKTCSHFEKNRRQAPGSIKNVISEHQRSLNTPFEEKHSSSNVSGAVWHDNVSAGFMHEYGIQNISISIATLQPNPLYAREPHTISKNFTVCSIQRLVGVELSYLLNDQRGKKLQKISAWTSRECSFISQRDFGTSEPTLPLFYCGFNEVV